MTVAVCGAVGSTTCTVTMVLSTRGCKLPSEIDSMSVRFRDLFQVDGKTVVRDRRRLSMMHLSGRLVDKPAAVGLLVKTQLRERSNAAHVQSSTEIVLCHRRIAFINTCFQTD